MISLRRVSKKFKLYRRPMDRVAEWLHLGRRHEEFWALRGIDLEIPRGRTVGIVGANGAGKSTLLKLITGTLLPTEGVIEIHGRVAALLELGTGFHPEFTGRQNIAINGQLLGLEPQEVSRLEPEIIAFSELGPFIDQPIRTYSSGMIMRLGFSIAAATNPELLIVDEALSVGDARFSQKCIKRIREFRDRGTTILFVSHDPAAVTTLCDEAVLLERGRVRSIGSPRLVLEEYNALLAASGTGNVEMRISRVSDDSDPRAPRRHGTFQAVISRLELADSQGRATEVFHPGEELVLRARVEFLADAQEPSVGFLIKDRLGLDLFGTNTTLLKQELGPHRAGQCAEVEVRVPLRLGYGDYSITVAVHEDETHLEACYEWSDNAAVFRVRHRDKPWWAGFVLMDPAVEVRRALAPEGAASSALVERFPELPDPLPLRAGPPSPYLAGFFEPAQGPRGECRRTRALCRFVFRPAAPMLCIRAAIDDEPLSPAAPVEVTLRLVGGAELGTLQLEAPQGLLAWELPEQTAGEAHVFELDVRRSGGDGLDVYGVSSTHTAAEEEQWPVTTPSKSSTT